MRSFSSPSHAPAFALLIASRMSLVADLLALSAAACTSVPPPSTHFGEHASTRSTPDALTTVRPTRVLGGDARSSARTHSIETCETPCMFSGKSHENTHAWAPARSRFAVACDDGRVDVVDVTGPEGAFHC